MVWSGWQVMQPLVNNGLFHHHQCTVPPTVQFFSGTAHNHFFSINHHHWNLARALRICQLGQLHPNRRRTSRQRRLTFLGLCQQNCSKLHHWQLHHCHHPDIIQLFQSSQGHSTASSLFSHNFFKVNQDDFQIHMREFSRVVLELDKQNPST